MTPRALKLTVSVLLWAGCSALVAGALGEGTGAIRASMSGMGHAVAGYISPLMLVAGGTRAAFAASHGRDFTQPLIEAIFGIALMSAA